jgi:hypothetical protein
MSRLLQVSSKPTDNKIHNHYWTEFQLMLFKIMFNTISLHTRPPVLLLNHFLFHLVAVTSSLLLKTIITPLLSFLYHFCNIWSWVKQISQSHTVLNLEFMEDTVSHPLCHFGQITLGNTIITGILFLCFQVIQKFKHKPVHNILYHGCITVWVPTSNKKATVNYC